jgi:hypothetical protein
MNFLLQHQEKHNHTYHFLILMDAVISAANRRNITNEQLFMWARKN